jgi:hypothetical protein
VESQTGAAAPVGMHQRLTPVLVRPGIGLGLSAQTTVDTATLHYGGQAVTHQLT